MNRHVVYAPRDFYVQGTPKPLKTFGIRSFFSERRLLLHVSPGSYYITFGIILYSSIAPLSLIPDLLTLSCERIHVRLLSFRPGSWYAEGRYNEQGGSL